MDKEGNLLKEWEIAALKKVQEREKRRKKMKQRFGQRSKGKFSNMAEFVREFENTMITQVEDIRGKHFAQGKELRQEQKESLEEQVRLINESMAEGLSSTA